MKQYQVFYRLQGCLNGNIYCLVVRARDYDSAEMRAYCEIDDNHTIMGIVEIS